VRTFLYIYTLVEKKLKLDYNLLLFALLLLYRFCIFVVYRINNECKRYIIGTFLYGYY